MPCRNIHFYLADDKNAGSGSDGCANNTPKRGLFFISMIKIRSYAKKGNNMSVVKYVYTATMPLR